MREALRASWGQMSFWTPRGAFRVVPSPHSPMSHMGFWMARGLRLPLRRHKASRRRGGHLTSLPHMSSCIFRAASLAQARDIRQRARFSRAN